MESRPDIQPGFTGIDRLLETVAWLCIVALWLVVILFYESLPEVIPTHFNAAGEVDDTGDKIVLLLMPVIGTLLFLGLTILSRYPRIFNFPVEINAENAFRQYTNAVRMLRYLKGMVALIFLWITAAVILKAGGQTSGGIGAWSLPLMLALILIPILYFVIKAIRQR